LLKQSVIHCHQMFISLIFVARCYASVAYAIMQCMSVRRSVTFMDSAKTIKYIFKICSLSGSHCWS